MKRKTLFVTIVQILCVVRPSSSGLFEFASTETTTENVPDATTTVYKKLPPSFGSFVENGRLLSTWNANLSTDTEEIDLSNLGITELDGYGIFDNFPALHKLDLSSNKLTSPQTLVNNFARVTPMILNLSRNNISKFAILSDRRFFDYMTTLAYDSSLFESKYFWSVDLSYNGLTDLSIDFDVVHFDLSNNKMRCHDKIKPLVDTSEKQIYVANLDLSHNLIDCQSEFFTSSLNTLDMSYNELRSLDASLLTGLRALTELYLSNNNIQYIHPEAFKSNNLLRKLYLGFNKIRHIYKWVWSPTHNLEYIDLFANQLGYLEWDNEIYARRSSRVRVSVGNNSNVDWSSGSITNYDFCPNCPWP